MWQKVLLANSALARKRNERKDDTQLVAGDSPEVKAEKLKKLDEKKSDDKMETQIKVLLSFVERLFFTACIVGIVVLSLC